MVVWALFQGQNLVSGEEELMEYPLYIRRTFASVDVFEASDEVELPKQTGKKQLYYGDFIRENVRQFIQKWGGVEEAALLRALEEARGIDRIRAIFALGYSPFRHALDTIAPFFASSNRIERSAVTCAMCVRRDERAFSFLAEYFLQDSLDASGAFIPEAESWYQDYYAVLPLILANWGPLEMNDVLRATLIRIATPEHQYKFGHGANTSANLYYALGRRGIFSALDDVELSERGRVMALFSLAAGFLNAYERYDQYPPRSIFYGEGFRKEMTSVWRRQFELSDQKYKRVLLHSINSGSHSLI